MCARLGWIAALGLVAGCFEPIIKDPGATAGEGSSSSGESMSSGGESSSSSGASSGSSSGSSSTPTSSDTTIDVDMTTTTTGEELPSPFFCDPHSLCDDAWKVEPCEACDALTSVSECILTAQATRSAGYVEVVRCDPGCRIERLTLRGSDTSDAVREVATLDGEGAIVSVASPERCTLQEVGYFEGCVAAYSPACADSEAWLVACEPYASAECPVL